MRSSNKRCGDCGVDKPLSASDSLSMSLWPVPCTDLRVSKYLLRYRSTRYGGAIRADGEKWRYRYLLEVCHVPAPRGCCYLAMDFQMLSVWPVTHTRITRAGQERGTAYLTAHHPDQHGPIHPASTWTYMSLYVLRLLALGDLISLTRWVPMAARPLDMAWTIPAGSLISVGSRPTHAQNIY
jgi:hypothetical protein